MTFCLEDYEMRAWLKLQSGCALVGSNISSCTYYLITPTYLKVLDDLFRDVASMRGVTLEEVWLNGFSQASLVNTILQAFSIVQDALGSLDYGEVRDMIL